jgi:hypothetical protein
VALVIAAGRFPTRVIQAFSWLQSRRAGRGVDPHFLIGHTHLPHKGEQLEQTLPYGADCGRTSSRIELLVAAGGKGARGMPQSGFAPELLWLVLCFVLGRHLNFPQARLSSCSAKKTRAQTFIPHTCPAMIAILALARRPGFFCSRSLDRGESNPSCHAPACGR